MTKPVANIAVQVRRLTLARERAKELPRGTVLASLDMSKLIGVNWPTLRAWCDDVPALEMNGAVVRGGNGTKYEFKPLKTIDGLLRHFRAIQASALKKQKRVRQMVGGGALASIPDEFSVDELQKLITLSIKVQEQLERQGRLVDADKVRSTLAVTFSAIQQAALRAAMDQDPTGQWPAHIRESFETAMRNVLKAIEAAARDCMSRFTETA